jgi:hypothetical protein
MANSPAYFEVQRALAFARAHSREKSFSFKDLSPLFAWTHVSRRVGGRMFRQLVARHPNLIECVGKTRQNEAVYQVIG